MHPLEACVTTGSAQALYSLGQALSVVPLISFAYRCVCLVCVLFTELAQELEALLTLRFDVGCLSRTLCRCLCVQGTRLGHSVILPDGAELFS